MHEIKAPHPIGTKGPFLFLAGSIEMGTAEMWQEEVVKMLADTAWTILNPRRDNWDDSWKQTADNPKFREQVEWELEGLERSDKILVYFAPETKAPVSLLELGLHAKAGKLLVVCPEGFWRKGNVDIVCKKYGIEQADSLKNACERLKVNP